MYNMTCMSKMRRFDVKYIIVSNIAYLLLLVGVFRNKTLIN